MAKAKKTIPASLRIRAEVARAIRQHARGNSKTEVCGVLVGSDADGVTSIEACIAGENASQGGAHVTFTQDAWEHIYKVKDRDYPNERIVGWYHSHPGFGVFLSDHDTFIHQNFFSSPQQVAWVYDPHSDEEGCFGWQGERLERLERFSVVDSKGGAVAGVLGKPEPGLIAANESGDWDEVARPSSGKPKEDEELTRLARTVSMVFSHLAVFLLGGLLVWYLLPRILIPVPVDPNTGQPLHGQQDLQPVKPNAQAPAQNYPDADRGAAPSDRNDSSNPPRGDVHQ
jgi:proteasome lid subunit RPN8/RPN11